jgi:hypothetical protein
MDMALTKKKADGGGWVVCVDGMPTAIHIEKGLPPKYRETQMYDVVDVATDSYLFESKSVHGAMSTLERIRDLLA